MNPLSANQIIQIWERGRDQHPIDRALIMLAPAYPEMTRDALADLSIGTRDAYLLTVREQTFGNTLNGAANCPQCNDSLEFSIRIENIRAEPTSGTERSSRLMLDDHVVEFRLLTSQDLAAAAQCEDVAASRSVLLERCVDRIVRNDSQISVADVLLTPFIFFVVIIGLINSFQIFPQVVIMTDGGPNGATQVMVERIYTYAFSYKKMGYASALSWVLFIIIFAFTMFQFKIQDKWVHYDR